jgi:hypothetical protein
MSEQIEYVDSDGRVPRQLATIDGIHALNQVLLCAIVLSAGGTLDINGLTTPEQVKRLLSYELKVSGRGNGTVRVEAIRRDD